MKRIISLALVLAMLVGVMPVYAGAEELRESEAAQESSQEAVQQEEALEEAEAPAILSWEGFHYTLLADGSASICGFDGVPEEENESLFVEIPAGINGAVVTEIADKAFAGNAEIEAVLLPETIKTIGNGAFEGCENLKVIAFLGEELAFGETLAKNSGKLNKILILDGYDFCNLEYILTQDFGEETVGSIRFQTFDTHESVINAFAVSMEDTQITVETADEVISGISTGMPSTEEISALSEDVITVSGKCGDNLTWTLFQDGTMVISGSGAVWYGAGTTEYDVYKEQIQHIVFEDGVTAVGEYAFDYFTNLETVTFPDTVKYIGSHAFGGCSGLKELVISDSVTSMGNWAFSGCVSLTDLSIGRGLTEISQGLFDGCTSLTTVVIPDSVTYIGSDAFNSCSSLKNVTIPTSVTAIGHSTAQGHSFAGCHSLEEIYIPDSVTDIGVETFVNCTNLKSIRLPSQLKEIQISLFSNCTSLETIEIPDGVESIGLYAFKGCTNLKEIDLPDSIVGIGGQAFYNCSSLTSIVIPKKCNLAGSGGWDYIFNGCTSLTTVTIPVGVTLICTGAFNLCPSITDVYYEGSEVQWNEIDIQSRNEDLLNATIHFNGSVAEGSFRNHKYSVHDLSMTWAEAKAYCENLGGHLVTITSAEEQVFIEGLLPDPCTKRQYWLGASLENGVWSWVTGEAFEYTNWDKGQPDHLSGEGYAEIFNFASASSAYPATRYKWNDITYNNVSGSNPVVGADAIGLICEYDDVSSTLGEVHYFREWDTENQIAYWGEFDYVGSQVTEETDTSFLENIEDLLNHYVLVQTKKREDNLTAPDTILSIKPVDAKVGIITSLDQGLEIDNVRYEYNVSLNFLGVGDEVRYYLHNGIVVGELTLILPAASTQNKPNYGSDNWETFPPADLAYSYLLDYETAWNNAYNAFMQAVEQALNDYGGKTLSSKDTAIANEAKRMKKNDEESYSRYITGDVGEYRDTAYLALATFFYEKVDGQGIDFSSIDLSSKSAETNLVNAILKGISGGHKTYTFQGVSYEIEAIAIGSAFGSMTITDGEKKITVIICSNQNDCNETTSEFLKGLRDLSANASYNVVTALCKDIFGKNIYELTKDYLTGIADKIERKFALTLSGIIGVDDVNGLFEKSGVGNFFDTLDKCYTYYEWTQKAKKLLEKANSDPFEAINQLKDIKFEDTSIKDGSVKSAMKSLKKAANNLNTAFNDYVSGTLVEKEEGLLRQICRAINIKCPVAVEVFNSSGEQIGYVDDDEIWYLDDLLITRNGHSKRIVMLTDDVPTLVITAKDYGTMNCCFEEFDENNDSKGRLNFYDISLSPEKVFSVTVRDNIDVYAEAFVIISGSEFIFPDEYIPAKEEAGVAITCDVIGVESLAAKGTGMYVRGDSVALSVETPVGYEFLGWFEGETLLSENLICEFTAKEDRHLVAKFQKDENVYINVTAFDGGTAIGGGIYSKGVTANIIAIPYNGYNFMGWYIGDEIISDNDEYSIVADTDLTLAAKFTPHDHAYSEPEFIWTENNTCSAKIICTNCGYEEVVECTVTSTTMPTTGVETGKILYKATVEINGQIYTDTKVAVHLTTELDSGTCGENLTWVLTSDGTLIISGNGEMNDWEFDWNTDESDAPWNKYCERITSVVIEDGVTSIGNWAFVRCSITEIVLPEGLKTIGEGSFALCDLQTVIIPASVTSIGDYIFFKCNSLEDVWFVGNAPLISDQAFDGEVLTCHYPTNNGTWTSNLRKHYGGTITWTSYMTEDSGGSSVEEVNRIETVPMYRLFNPNTGEHFYTGSEEERDKLQSVGWNYEGVAWNAPVYIGEPVYRVFNPNSGDHHYTMSLEEVENLKKVGWQYENVAWNSAPANHGESVPQYRLYNPNADLGCHHYTSSLEERQTLVDAGWQFEGIGWFGMLK